MLSTARQEFREIGRCWSPGKRGEFCAEVTVERLPSDYVEILRREYPQREGDNGWIHVRTLVPRALSAGATWERILAGTRAYKAHCDKTGKTGTELVKQARTFFGPNAYFDEWADMVPPQTAQQARDTAQWELLKGRATVVGFRAPYPVDTLATYETALRQHENTVTPISRVRV